MMPLAFDLISTFVIGSTLPVATTERRMVPRSTVRDLRRVNRGGGAGERREAPRCRQRQGPPAADITNGLTVISSSSRDGLRTGPN